MTRRGQVSLEVLTSVLLLLFLFVMALLLIEQNKQSFERAQQNIGEQEVCIQLSSTITYMSSNPPYTETKFELLHDTNITNNIVFVGDAFCPVLGKVANVQLYRGIVKGFDLNGTVVFTNDVNYTPFTPPINPGGGGDVGNATILLIDDQGQTWEDEVLADDALYAISQDNQSVDPDWVEFRFQNLGLTSANVINSVIVYLKHAESYHVGLSGPQNLVQCHNGSSWIDIESYTPSFSEIYHVTPDISSCISDWNLANNARIRMTYEPAGEGQTISIDYGFIDVNFSQNGILIDLWEVQSDLPQPVDFYTDVNSTSNTFGWSAIGNDGWDWNKLTYGGSIDTAIRFNTDLDYDGDISDSVVSNSHALELRLGGIVLGAPIDPDDNATTGPVTSGAFGIQFDLNSDVYALISSGSELRYSFLYTLDTDSEDNSLDAGEEVWVKLRFSDGNTTTYLGSDLDFNSTDFDSTNELWFSESPSDLAQFYTTNLSSLVSGPGTYYIDFGAALGDWDTPREGLAIYFDNVNLVVI